MTGFLRGVAAAMLAGAATGGRSLTGVAALVLTSPGGAVRQPDKVLGRPVIKALVCLAATGEYVADKLPTTPSRLEPGSLSLRAVAAAASGVIIALSTPTPATTKLDAADSGIDESAPTLDDDQDPVGDRLVQILGYAAVATGSALMTAWLGSRWRRWAGSRFGNELVPAGIEDAAVIGLAAAVVKLA